MESVRKPLVELLLVSVIIQTGIVLVCRARTGSVAGYAFSSLDCTEYYHLALNLAEAGVFSRTMDFPLVPDTWRTPGYPVVLAVVVFLLGDAPWKLVLFQQLLSIANVMLLALIVQRYASSRMAMLAGFLFLVEPFHQLYSLWLLSTTVFTTVLLSTWIVWIRASDRQSVGGFLLAGVLSGFMVLVRPLAVAVPFLLAVGIVLQAMRSRHRLPAAFMRAGVFICSALVVMASWMLRNKVIAGHFALSSQGGVVFAYFKATEVILWREDRTTQRYSETSVEDHGMPDGHSVWDDIDRRLQQHFADADPQHLSSLNWRHLAQGNESQFDPFEVSAALRRIGLDLLMESPGSTVACSLARCAAILTFPLCLALSPPEMPQPPSRLKSLVIGLVYLALLIAVLVNLCRGRLSLRLVWFPLAVTVALLLATTPQLDPRFRVPMIPLLIFAAVVTDRTRGSVGEHR